MRTIIGLLILIYLTGCTLRDPAAFAAHQRAYQLDQRFEALERQRQADQYGNYQRYLNRHIRDRGTFIPY